MEAVEEKRARYEEELDRVNDMLTESESRRQALQKEVDLLLEQVRAFFGHLPCRFVANWDIPIISTKIVFFYCLSSFLKSARSYSYFSPFVDQRSPQRVSMRSWDYSFQSIQCLFPFDDILFHSVDCDQARNLSEICFKFWCFGPPIFLGAPNLWPTFINSGHHETCQNLVPIDRATSEIRRRKRKERKTSR